MTSIYSIIIVVILAICCHRKYAEDKMPPDKPSPIQLSQDDTSELTAPRPSPPLNLTLHNSSDTALSQGGHNISLNQTEEIAQCKAKGLPRWEEIDMVNPRDFIRVRDIVLRETEPAVYVPDQDDCMTECDKRICMAWEFDYISSLCTVAYDYQRVPPPLASSQMVTARKHIVQYVGQEVKPKDKYCFETKEDRNKMLEERGWLEGETTDTAAPTDITEADTSTQEMTSVSHTPSGSTNSESTVAQEIESTSSSPPSSDSSSSAHPVPDSSSSSTFADRSSTSNDPEGSESTSSQTLSSDGTDSVSSTVSEGSTGMSSSEKSSTMMDSSSTGGSGTTTMAGKIAGEAIVSGGNGIFIHDEESMGINITKQDGRVKIIVSYKCKLIFSSTNPSGVDVSSTFNWFKPTNGTYEFDMKGHTNIRVTGECR